MSPVRTLLAAGLLSTPFASTLAAQDYPLRLDPVPGRYTPVDQREVPGKVGQWQLIAKPSLNGYFQPVRVLLPTQGLVSFYTPESTQPVLTQGPAQAAMLVGHVYRFQVTGLAEFPGLELYPSLELIDRMHPPAGREQEFPIPVEITLAEIKAVGEGRMVTKVIYLESPRLPSTDPVEPGRLLTYDAPASSNLLDSAGQLGRPMAILRMGGRVPDPRNPQDEMFARRPPIQIQAVGGANAMSPVVNAQSLAQ